jgi:hypothetical protein
MALKIIENNCTARPSARKTTKFCFSRRPQGLRLKKLKFFQGKFFQGNIVQYNYLLQTFEIYSKWRNIGWFGRAFINLSEKVN